MKKIKLEKIDTHLSAKLKNKDFKKCYERERAIVALAQRIAELRQKKGLRQSDLAKKMHVSQQFISQIETAQEKNLTIDTLVYIAQSLGRGVSITFPKMGGSDYSLKIA